MALRRRGDDAAPNERRSRSRDLVPVRRRAARVPEHRRACARRRLVGRGALRRCRRTRRSGYLLLSRRAGWRSYFRSTIAHNTVEVAGRSQSVEGGPFLWLAARERQRNRCRGHRRCRRVESGARRLPPAGPERPWHRRCVRLDRATRSIDIVDEVGGGSFDVRLAFHLGPEVEAELDQEGAILRWPGALVPGSARLELCHQLRWTVHRGQTDPILGWYSPGLGRRVPAVTLIGRGRSGGGMPLTTRLEFFDVRHPGTHRHPESSVSCWPNAIVGHLPSNRPEIG